MVSEKDKMIMQREEIIRDKEKLSQHTIQQKDEHLQENQREIFNLQGQLQQIDAEVMIGDLYTELNE